MILHSQIADTKVSVTWHQDTKGKIHIEAITVAEDGRALTVTRTPELDAQFEKLILTLCEAGAASVAKQEQSRNEPL